MGEYSFLPDGAVSIPEAVDSREPAYSFLPKGAERISDPQDFGSTVPAALRGTKYESDAEKISRYFLATSEDPLDRAVDLDYGDLKNALRQYRGLSPDQAAKVQKIADSNGQPFDMVARTFQEADDWNYAIDTFNSLLEKNPDGKLKYPVIASYLSNPEFVAQARDDMQRLKEVEKAVYTYSGKTTSHAIRAGFNEMQVNALNTLKAVFDIQSSIAGGVGTFYDVLRLINPQAANRITTGGAPLSAGEAVQQVAEYAARGAAANIAEEIDIQRGQQPLELDLKGFDYYLYQAQRVVPQVVGTTAVGLAATPLGSAAQIVAPAAFIASHIFGGTYGQLTERGVSNERAAIAAFGNAMAQSVIETFGISKFLNLLTKGTGTRQLLQKTFTAVASEGLTEFLQAYPELAAQVFGTAELTGATPAEQAENFIKGIPEATAQGLFEALVVAPIPFFGGMGRVSYDYLRYRKSGAEAEAYQNIRDKVLNSNLVKRNPKKAATIINEMAAKAPDSIQNVYITSEALKAFYQDNTEGYEEVLRTLNLAEQARESDETGKAMEIPLGDWTANYAGSELEAAVQNDLKYDVNGVSVNEIQADKLKQDLLDDISFMAREIERVKGNLPEDVTDRLKAMRDSLLVPRTEGGLGLKAEDADATMALLVEGSKAISQRQGETVSEWFARVNPIIENQLVAGPDGARGSILFDKGQTVIKVFKGADKSTVLHEMGHLFVGEMQRIAVDGKDEQVAADLQRLTDFGGGDLSVPGPAIEKVMQAWETWLAEGKAPSIELASVFSRFKDWLLSIYKRVAGKQVEINDDIRAIFSRLLASESDIRDAAKFYGMRETLVDSMPVQDKSREEVKKKREAAIKDANERQLRKYMRVHYDLIGGKQAVREQAERDISAIPAYKMLEDGVQFEPGTLAGVYGADVELQLKEKGYVGKRQKVAKDKSLHALVLQYGGIDPASLDGEQRSRFKEEKLFGVTRKGGIKIDVLVSQLVSEGLLQVPTDMNPVDYFTELLYSRYKFPAEVEIFSPFADVGLVAMDYDYESPEAMINDLMSKPRRSEAVKARYDQLIKDIEDKFMADITKGELVPGTDAIHSDKSLEYLVAEFQLLSETLDKEVAKAAVKQSDRVQRMAYSSAAADVLNRTTISRAARYDLYAKTENTFSKQYEKAILDGRLDEARSLMSKRLLNHALVLESVRIRDFKKSVDKFYKATNLKNKLGNTEYKYREVISDLVATYRMSNVKGLEAKEGPLNLAGLDDYSKSIIPAWMVAKQLPEGFTDWNDLTVERAKQLDSVVKSLMSYGTGELRSIKDARFRTKDEFVNTVLESAKDLPNKKKNVQTLPGKLGRFKDVAFSELTMMEFLFEELDGFEFTKEVSFGPLRTLLNQFLKNEATFQDLKQKVMDAADPHWKILLAAKQRIETERAVHYPATAKGVFDRVTRAEPTIDVEDLIPTSEKEKKVGRHRRTVENIISILLNYGNTGNKSALQNYYGFTDEQIQNLSSLFTKEELNAIQGIWDATNILFPDSDKVHFRMHNKHMTKVEALPVTFRSKDGEDVTLKGGYYPLIFDHELSTTAQKIREDEIDLNRSQAVLRTVTAKDGFSMSRKEGHSLPPRLQLNVWTTHISDVARYITHGEILRDTNMIYLDKRFRELVEDKAGSEMYSAMGDWLKSNARPGRTEQQGVFNDLIMSGYRMSTVAILGGKFLVGVKQRLSMYSGARALAQMGGDYGGWGPIFRAMSKTNASSSILGLSTAESWEAVTKLSGFMRARQGNINQAISDLRKSFKALNKKFKIAGIEFDMDDVSDFMMEWIQMNDRATVGVIWKAAFDESIRLGKANTVEEAVTVADSIVRTTQPSTLPPDLAKLQRDQGPIRVMVAFMSWTLKYTNILASQNKALRAGAITKRQYFQHVLYESVFSPWSATLLTSLFMYHELPEWYEWITGPIENILAGIPFLRDISGAIKYRKDIGANTAFEGINRGVKAAVSTKEFFMDEKELSTVLWDVARVIEFYSKIPALNVVKDMKRQYDNIINEGGE